MRITSITPMKNEAPFLLEWVAYHRLIGVNDILVFTNHCTDGTDLMLERLDTARSEIALRHGDDVGLGHGRKEV